jgi:hypothetical protein
MQNQIPFYLNVDLSWDSKTQFDVIRENTKKIGPDWDAEQSQINMFIEAMESLSPNPSLIELGTSGVGGSIYSVLFEKFFDYKCTIINTEPRKDLIDRVKQEWSGVHLINAKLYHGYTGESAQLSNSFMNLLDASTCGEKLRVSKLMQDSNLTQLDILHADIQEREVDLLLELEEDKCFDKINYLFISTHSPSLHTQCLDIINQNTPRDIIFSDPYAGGCGDGLIVIKKK